MRLLYPLKQRHRRGGIDAVGGQTDYLVRLGIQCAVQIQATTTRIGDKLFFLPPTNPAVCRSGIVRRVRRVCKIQRCLGRLVRHEFPEASHEFLLFLTIRLARNMLGLLVNEAQGMQKKAHAADAVGNAESVKHMIDDALAVHVEIVVKVTGKLFALLRRELEGTAIVLVLQETVYAAVLESFDQISDCLLVEEGDFRHLWHGLAFVEVKNRRRPAVLASGEVAAVEE